MTHLLWLSLLTFWCSPPCWGQISHTYYVTPDVTTNCPKDPCYNITTYALKRLKYFHSSSEFVFLPGVHRLETDAMFAFVSNIRLRGSEDSAFLYRNVSSNVHQYGFDPYNSDESVTYYESTAQIRCDGPERGFSFYLVTNITIKNLTILNCGSTFSSNPVGLKLWETLPFKVNVSVVLMDVTNILIDGVSIQNGTGYGLGGLNVQGDIQITRSSFIGNNQVVKSRLQKDKINNSHQCKRFAEMYRFINNGSYNCSGKDAGGNVAFLYLSNYTGSRILMNISDCIFALGVNEGQLNDNGQLGLSCQYPAQSGTGLVIATVYYVDIWAEVSVTVSNTISYRNQARVGANFHFSLKSIANALTCINVSSIGGVASFGAGMFVVFDRSSNSWPMPNVLISDSSFDCNYSPVLQAHTFNGPGVLLNNSSFTSTSILLVGDGPNEVNQCKLYYTTTSIKGVYSFVNSLLLHSPTYLYSNSTARYEGCHVVDSTINAFSSTISLRGNNSFVDASSQSVGGAIALRSSKIVFEEGVNATFRNNTAVNGGAIYMDSLSFMNFTEKWSVSLFFIDNIAFLYGGAIYADDSFEVPTSHCFFLVDAILSKDVKFLAYFKGNVARAAGSNLYGGRSLCFKSSYILDNLYLDTYVDRRDVMDKLLMPLDVENSLSLVAGDPVNVLMCSANVSTPTIDSIVVEKSVYPGDEITLWLVAVDKDNVAVPEIVLVYDSYYASGDSLISAIRTSTSCDLYRILLPARYFVNLSEKVKNITLFLSTQTSFMKQANTLYKLNVRLLTCPVGFDEQVGVTHSCICKPLLTQHGVSCNISDQTITKNGNMWIGQLNNNHTDLGIFDQCPYDYCNNEKNIKVVDLDSQCAYDRKNVLCGECQDGWSMTFGTSRCERCTDYYLLLLVPFALMGLALVGILFLLNMTLSNGTLNGLIFYANIIRINDSMFFSSNSITSSLGHFYVRFMSTFIAWLNLDFGIETCFYNGMDSYAKTWLQFVFPTYIFGLIGAIILAGRYSSTISNWRGFRSAVPVLATLILLSFSKFLRTTIVIFSFGSIEAENSPVFLAWLYDGNIKYFELKHMILFIAGILITVFLIFPYTALLLLIPVLQSRSDWRVLRWVNNLKPLLDCYAGPYKDKYRCWSGVLVGARVPLYLLFSLFYSNINVRLLCIVISVFIYLQLLCSMSVYKNLSHLVLEVFFHINLLTISITYLFDPNQNTSLPVYTIVQIGIGCAFVCFVAMICAQIIIKCGYTRCLNKGPCLRDVQNVIKSSSEAELKDAAAEESEELLRESLVDLNS